MNLNSFSNFNSASYRPSDLIASAQILHLNGQVPRSKYMRKSVPRPGSLAPPSAQPFRPKPKLKVDMDFCWRLRPGNQYTKNKEKSLGKPTTSWVGDKHKNALFGLGTRPLALAVLGADS